LVALVLALGGGGWYSGTNASLQRPPAAGWDRVVEARPELQELMPLLSRADAQTVKVITRTLAERNK